MTSKRKKLILATAADLAVDFIDYDRRGDEELGSGEIEAAIKSNEVTVDEIVKQFHEKLNEELSRRP